MDGGAGLNDIPFKGTSESRTSLLGGHVDLVAMSVSEFVMDKESTGLFQALAQLGPARAPTLPEVPTARDLGFDIVISSERGFAAPRGVAGEIMERLQKAIAAAVTDPEFLRGTTSDIVLRLTAVTAVGLGTNYLAYSLMFASHAPFAIGTAARDRWLQLMNRALDESSLPAEAHATLKSFFASTATFLINRPE